MSNTATGVSLDRQTRSAQSVGRLVVAMRSRSSRVELMSACALYLVFACFLTWPLVINLTHSIFGAPGDPYGTITFYRELVDHHLNPFLPGTFGQLAAPGGLAVPWARDLASAPGVLSLYLLTVMFGAVPALGLYILAGYILTGTVTFLFARRLTSSPWAALIAGWAFAFYPFAIFSGQTHPDYTQGWVIMLAVWRMVELLRRPSRRNGVLAGLAVVLGMWWSPYFILLVGLAYVVITAVALVVARHENRLATVLPPQLIAVLILALFAVYLGVLTQLGVAEGLGVRTNGVQDLYTYAARPLEYLVPGAASPLFGHATRVYLETHGYVEELYLGITVIGLALAALVAGARRKLAPGLNRTVLVLGLVAAVAAATSMPPKERILGVAVPFPSHYIAQFTTTWRVYARLGMVVMLSLSVLAAVGLNVLARARATGVRIAILSLATVLIPLDLWSHQSGHVYRISTPGIFRTLARQPPGLVAEYPLPAIGHNIYRDIFYNSVYDKPMINGYMEGTVQEYRAFSLNNLANPATASGLATLGVRYVVLDANPAALGWPPAGVPGSGFRLLAEESYADLYVVTAQPASPALPATGQGFELRSGSHGAVSLLTQREGTIELAGTCSTCAGVLSMTVVSDGGPRLVTITDSHGRVLGRGSVGEARRIRIPLRFSKHKTLYLAASPGPQEVRHGSENLRASVAVSGLKFTGTERKR